MSITLLDCARSLGVTKATIKYRLSSLSDTEKERIGSQWYITDEGITTLKKMLNIKDDASESVYIKMPNIHATENRSEPDDENIEDPEPIIQDETADPDKNAWYREQINDLKEQNNNLTEQNTQLTKLLNQQQLLTSQTMKDYQERLALPDASERASKVKSGVIIVLCVIIIALISLIAWLIYYYS